MSPPKNILITLISFIRETHNKSNQKNLSTESLYLLYCCQKVFDILKLVICQIIYQFCKHHLYDTINIKYYQLNG